MTSNGGNGKGHSEVICIELLCCSNRTLHFFEMLHQGVDSMLLDDPLIPGQVCREFPDVLKGQPHTSEYVGRASTVRVKKLYQDAPFVEDRLIYHIRSVLVIDLQAEGFQWDKASGHLLIWFVFGSLWARAMFGHNDS